MHGSTVDLAYRSAIAWVGEWRTSVGPETWDPEAWSQQQLSDPVVSADDLLLASSRDSRGLAEEVFEVRPTDANLRTFAEVSLDEVKEQYVRLNRRLFDRAFHLFVAVISESPEVVDLNQALGIPPYDGYLSVLAVLADADRLLPFKIRWHGRSLDEVDLSARVSSVLSWLQAVPTSPKVPAPDLPSDLLDLIELARAGDLSSGGKSELVRTLCDLDRASFLEAVDRLWPWINWHDAPCGWLDKNEEVAGRLWEITTELPDLAEPGALRLAPWKTGVGEPRDLELRVKMTTRGPLRDVSLRVRRRPSGLYGVQ